MTDFSKASADSRQIKIDRWFPGRCKEWKCRVFKILFANERIPRRARKSAFLGIVHFAHCYTFLNGHSFLKHFISYCIRWQETAFHTASVRKQVLEPKLSASTFLCTKQKRQRHSDGNLLPLQCLCFFVFCNLA